jgi:hypothetical protein
MARARLTLQFTSFLVGGELELILDVHQARIEGALVGGEVVYQSSSLVSCRTKPHS